MPSTFATRARVCVVAVVAAGLGCSNAKMTSDATMAATWDQYRSDASRSGVHDAQPIVPPLYQVWRRKTGRNPQVEPIVVGDHLIVPTSDRQIRVIERETGRPSWRRKVGGVPSIGLVAGQGQVFVGHGVPDPGLTALSLRDGSVTWRADHIVPRGTPALLGDTLFVSDLRRGLTALDAASGDTLWTAGNESRWPAPLAAAAGQVIVADESDSVRSFRSRDGKQMWSAPSEGGVRSAPLITGDSVIVCTVDGDVVRLSRATGDVMWRESLGARVYASMLTTGELIFVAGLNAQFTAIDVADGHVRWRVRLDGAVRAAPSLAGDIAVVPTMTGACQLVSLSEERVLHTVDLDHAIRAGAVVAGRYIYAVDEGGILVAYESS